MRDVREPELERVPAHMVWELALAFVSRPSGTANGVSLKSALQDAARQLVALQKEPTSERVVPNSTDWSIHPTLRYQMQVHEVELFDFTGLMTQMADVIVRREDHEVK